jgi:hypothetical protein
MPLAKIIYYKINSIKLNYIELSHFLLEPTEMVDNKLTPFETIPLALKPITPGVQYILFLSCGNLIP